jgi:hypothetical protein
MHFYASEYTSTPSVGEAELVSKGTQRPALREKTEKGGQATLECTGISSFMARHSALKIRSKRLRENAQAA